MGDALSQHCIHVIHHVQIAQIVQNAQNVYQGNSFRQISFVLQFVLTVIKAIHQHNGAKYAINNVQHAVVQIQINVRVALEIDIYSDHNVSQLVPMAIIAIQVVIHVIIAMNHVQHAVVQTITNVYHVHQEVFSMITNALINVPMDIMEMRMKFVNSVVQNVQHAVVQTITNA